MSSIDFTSKISVARDLRNGLKSRTRHYLNGCIAYAKQWIWSKMAAKVSCRI